MARKILTPLDITTGGNAITSSAIGVVPLTVKAASGQTADLFQIQNNSASPISGFDSAGNLFVNKTSYGSSIVSAAPGSVTYWKIATLPVSSGGTYDHIIVDTVLDDDWGSVQKANAKVLFSNRNAFTYRYYLNGTVRSAARILAYTETNGSVSIYLRAGSANYCTFSYNVTHGVDSGVTVFESPTSTTTAPTGTLAFDSSVIATYVPESYIPYTGQPIIRGLVNSSGAVSGASFVKTGGTSSQFLKADGSSDSNTYLATNTSSNLYGSSYFAGHNPEGRFMYNAYLSNDMANARLRGSAVAATQNGVSYSISDANWDAMFDGTASFFNISPTSGFTFPLVITVPLPRTLTYGAWVGISFGGSTFRANSVTIEVFSLDSSSWVTVSTTTTNTSEDIFSTVSGLTNGNATGINQVRYTISSPNSTQLRIQHLWAYNFNSDMWSTTMMPRAGGSFYGPVTNTTIAPASVPLTVKGAASQSANIVEIQNSSSSVLTSITSAGNLNTGQVRTGTTSGLAQLSVVAGASGTIGTVIRGASGQTADLLQIQNSTPSTLLKIDQNGFLTVGGATVISNSLISSTPYGTTQVGIAVRGTSGQTANLQEWQTSTPTTVASVSAAGVISTSAGLTLSGASSPITLNGSVGTSGQVLTSAGAGATPTWTTVGGTFTGGTLTSGLVLAAGTNAPLLPLRFQANASTPAATAGAMDYDGDIFYATTSGTATGRLMVPAIARVFSNANATAATTNSSQSIFQAGARALTLEAAKTYYFRLNLGVNFTFSSVPAAIQLVPTFSQTPVAINYSAVFASGTSGGVQSFRTTSTSAVSVSPSLSASVTGATIIVEGFFRTNATTGGTVEFKYQISTGGGSSATAQTGTLLEIEKIGTGAPGIISGAWA